MLISRGAKLFAYPIPRDLGFAPNPFHGYCTLATCKPDVRKNAKVNDWVLGLAAANIKEKKHHCIFLMEVTEKLSYQEYWEDARFELKKPIRNGSKVQILGDNIYHKDEDANWIQEDSHHSNSDGTTHVENLKRDTSRTDKVLISKNFIYFGCEAITLDLDRLEYRRIRNYKGYHLDTETYVRSVIEKIMAKPDQVNTVVGDPIHFGKFDSRVDQGSGKYF